MDGRTALVLDVKRVTRRLTSRKLQTHIDAIYRRICLKPIFSHEVPRAAKNTLTMNVCSSK